MSGRPERTTGTMPITDALVWVEAYQVQSYGGEPFAVGQHVTWPISRQFNERALTEHVGADTAAQISMGVDWHALRPEDTVDHTGIGRQRSTVSTSPAIS